MEQKVSIFCFFFFISLSLVFLYVFQSSAEYLVFYLYWEAESCLLHHGLLELHHKILGGTSVDKLRDKVWIQVRFNEQFAIFCVWGHKEKRALKLWTSQAAPEATEGVQACCIVTCHTVLWHLEVNCYHMAGPPHPLRWGWTTLCLRLALTKGFCYAIKWQVNAGRHEVLTGVAVPR